MVAILGERRRESSGPVNARVETVMTGKYFKQLWPNGRALAPANGWFEWVKDPATRGRSSLTSPG
jgi:putative SOS response-associated peptidase YedK